MVPSELLSLSTNRPVQHRNSTQPNPHTHITFWHCCSLLACW